MYFHLSGLLLSWVPVGIDIQSDNAFFKYWSWVSWEYLNLWFGNAKTNGIFLLLMLLLTSVCLFYKVACSNFTKVKYFKPNFRIEVCPIVNFDAPKLVEMSARWRSITKKKKKKLLLLQLRVDSMETTLSEFSFFLFSFLNDSDHPCRTRNGPHVSVGRKLVGSVSFIVISNPKDSKLLFDSMDTLHPSH